MSMSSLIPRKDSVIDEEEINFWEEYIHSFKIEELSPINVDSTIFAYRTNIRSFLLQLGVRSEHVYPIMRINGYEKVTDITIKDSVLLTPSPEKLDEFRTIMKMK